MSHHELPGGSELVRTTDLFDNDTVPAGLLRAHRVADGIWGRLVVHAGIVGFVFEHEPHQRHVIAAGESIVIPPARPHHVELDGPATFAVEFYRTAIAPPAPGTESSGLTDHP